MNLFIRNLDELLYFHGLKLFAEIDYLNEIVDLDSLDTLNISPLYPHKQIIKFIIYLTEIERKNPHLFEISISDLHFILNLFMY